MIFEVSKISKMFCHIRISIISLLYSHCSSLISCLFCFPLLWLFCIVLFFDHYSMSDFSDIYHKGGIVGEKKDFKDDEKLALLQKGELVIPKDTTRFLLDVLRETTSPHTQLVNGMAKVRPTLSDAVESITNNNTTDNRDNSVKEVTVNNEIHFDVKQKLDKEEIYRCQKIIGEASAEHILEAFTKRGIKPTAKLF